MKLFSFQHVWGGSVLEASHFHVSCSTQSASVEYPPPHCFLYDVAIDLVSIWATHPSLFLLRQARPPLTSWKENKIWESQSTLSWSTARLDIFLCARWNFTETTYHRSWAMQRPVQSPMSRILSLILYAAIFWCSVSSIMRAVCMLLFGQSVRFFTGLKKKNWCQSNGRILLTELKRHTFRNRSLNPFPLKMLIPCYEHVGEIASSTKGIKRWFSSF